MTARGRLVAIGMALALLAGASACVSDTKKADAPEPTPANIIDGTHTQVIRMPDGFRNVAFTCYGATGLYVTSRGYYESGSSDFTSLPSSIATVPNDPHCAG